MKTIYSVLVGLHVLTVIALIGLLLAEGRKPVKRIPRGVTHSGLTAMVLGIAMIAINAIRHNGDKAVALLNHTKFGVKFLLLAIVLGIAFKFAKKPSISTQTWAALLGLSVANFIIAGAWQ